MSLVNLEIPLFAIERLLKAVETIAECCERMFPAPYTTGDSRLAPPEPGLSIVSNEDVAEEQVKVTLRARGFKPDDIDKLLEEALNEDAEVG